jgi:V8-like Glu-specific endopeptidase
MQVVDMSGKPLLVIGLALGLFSLFVIPSGAVGSEPGDDLGIVSWSSVPGPPKQQVLADIAAAGEGVRAANVFPPDDRFAVSDTTAPIWRTITLLMLYGPYGEPLGDCSGVFIGPNVVLTAAHCLYFQGEYVSSVFAAPGATSEAPVLGLEEAFMFAVPNGWADTEGALPEGAPVHVSPFDWGIVVFQGDPFGGQLAPYPFMAHAPDEFFSAATTIIATAGFPGDKPFGSMWAAASDEYFVDNTYLYTHIDIFPGQSGSPLFAIDDDDFFIFSVVSIGSGIANVSVRFTPPVLDALKSYCTQLGCSVKTYLWVPDELPPPTPTSTATLAHTPTATATPSPTPSPSPTPVTPTPSVPAGPGRVFRVLTPFLSRD